MKLRLFVPILLVVPALAGCGGSSGSSGAASEQAKAIASAEAQGAAHASSSPGAAPSSKASAAASSAAAGDGSNTCPDQTINGYKITDVLLTDGATCAQFSKVAASPQIAGASSDFSVDGFQCDVEAVSLVSCEMNNSLVRINFVADKQ